MNTRNDAGFSLIEVMIASVILAGVVFMTMLILFTSTTAANKASVAMDCEQRARQISEHLKAEFLNARFGQYTYDDGTGDLAAEDPTGNPATNVTFDVSGISYSLGIFNNNTEIRYQKPLVYDSTGSYYNNKLHYGYAVTGTLVEQAGLVAWIRFEGIDGYRESEDADPPTQPVNLPAPFPAIAALDVEVVLKDINKDGDFEDTFVRGRLRRFIVAPDGHTLAAGGNILSSELLDQEIFLRVDPAGASLFNGNIGDDAVEAGNHALSANDPLFRFVDGAWPDDSTVLITGGNFLSRGKEIILNVTVADWGENRKEIMWRTNTLSAKFRNPQQ